MTTDDNKAIIRRFTEELINTASPKVAAELVAPDALFHIGRPEPLRGPDGVLAIVQMMRSGFSDVRWTLEEMIAEDDKVAARFTIRGTHDGTFFGAPATGRQIIGRSTSIYRLAHERIIEDQGFPDLLGMLVQIGAVPGM